MLKNAEAAVDDFEELERLTDYAVQLRYEVDLPPLNLERDLWNQKVTDFLDGVAEKLAN